MNFALLFLAVGCRQADPVEQFTQYLKAKPRTEVKFTVVTNGTAGEGTYWIDSDRAQRLEATWGPWKFAFLQDQKSALEIERSTKTYSEYGPNHLYVPESRISDLPTYAYPLPILTGDIRRIWPGAVTFTKQGEDQINGVKSVHMVGKHTGQASVTSEAWIAEDGRLMRYGYVLTTSSGQIKSVFDFTSYREIAANEKPFKLEIPDGYLPDSLPHESEPILPGMALPHELAQQENGKTLFVLIDPTSKVCLDALAVTKKDLNPTAITATEKLLEATNASGLPFFILTDGKGKVARIWFGFDRTDSNAFIAEVKKAMKE